MSHSTKIKATGPNAEQIDYWNSDTGERWARYQDKLDAMLQPFSHAVLERAQLKPGDHIMDIGCGCGATTLEAAMRVGTSGRALGVDISTPMIARARARARETGSSAEFMLADAATENFSQASFDTLISRFGIMFFLDPVSAFAHLRKTLAPEGRVSLVCWRTMRENGWVSVPYAAALPHIPEPEKPVPGAPGPFAFADRDRFRGILEQAGYSGIEIDPFDASLTIGSGPDPVESALEQTMEIGPLSRAIKTLPEENRMRVMEAVRDALVREVANGEVRLDGAVWLVSAKA